MSPRQHAPFSQKFSKGGVALFDAIDTTKNMDRDSRPSSLATKLTYTIPYLPYDIVFREKIGKIDLC